MTNHKIILGDSRKMTEVEDASIHLIVTSPPYWQLKDYGSAEQIGYHQSYEEYINNLNLVWDECFRVLHDGCRLCINIGDQFARSVYYGRYKVIPIRTEIIKFCEARGFDYMGAIIWQKVTTSNTTGGGIQMGSYPYPRNGILKLDYEFILVFKKLGEAPKPTKENKELSKMTAEEWNTFFAGHWNFAGARQDKHLAAFPEELPKRLIKMFSFVGDTVLDPFLGSGTTSVTAKKLERNSIGYEINPDFFPVINERLGAKQTDLNGTKFEFTEQKKIEGIDSRIAELPYIFKDPHGFDKKVDPKKLQYGSKIDKNGSNSRDELFSIKEVISSEKLRLHNNLIVKLLGIKENPLNINQAKAFLAERTQGKKVFLKFDKMKYDNENNLLCYMYLENKTFLNAHLIKNGLALVDTDIDFKYKDKFYSLFKECNG
jgi:site-specific DNA-methyltransferase (adenine-specific)